ncbi:MAG TPA: alpha/beta hydrolase [Marinobacterium sp.]|nr:alpha/beta hydrolase [Marinobacterium sp.]
MTRRSPSNAQPGIFEHAGHRIAYRIYTHAQVTSGRRLVLLHGAGVAGRHTWESLQHFLTGWTEILVPDLRGAGDTESLDQQEHPFLVEELVADLQALLNNIGWRQFDLGGYSLGGLVSMLLKQQLRGQVEKQFLLESAALDRMDWRETVSVRQQFAAAAKVLHQQDSISGIKQFLDTISPNRRVSEQVERLTIDRLGERAKGFAHSLEAVNAAINQIDREKLLGAQGDVSSFIGSLSVEPMHELHRSLAERMPNWHYFLIPGTDHSLPYQKPRQIAQLMNQELARYLNRSS